MKKILVGFALIYVCLALPADITKPDSPNVVPIISEDIDQSADGAYHYRYEHIIFDNGKKVAIRHF